MEDIEPAEAVEMYLADRQPDTSQATIDSHRSRLSFFIDWCEDADEGDIEYLSKLDPFDRNRYKLWRSTDINNVTLKTQLDTLRVMLKWAEKTGLAKPDIAQAVVSPSLAEGENVRDVMLEEDAANAIIDYLHTYEYASSDHVTMLLLWRCIVRRGTLRAIDLGDVELDTDEPVPHEWFDTSPLRKSLKHYWEYSLHSNTQNKTNLQIARSVKVRTTK